jgi:hypothetical protein
MRRPDVEPEHVDSRLESFVFCRTGPFVQPIDGKIVLGWTSDEGCSARPSINDLHRLAVTNQIRAVRNELNVDHYWVTGQGQMRGPNLSDQGDSKERIRNQSTSDLFLRPIEIEMRRSTNASQIRQKCRNGRHAFGTDN